MDLLKWLMIGIMIAAAVGVLCFTLPLISRRQVKPRRRKLKDDEELVVSNNKEHKNLREKLKEEAIRRSEPWRMVPERLLMTRVRIVSADDELNHAVGIAVSYDRNNRNFHVVLLQNGDVARVSLDNIEPINVFEVLSVKVVNAVEVRMREEAQVRARATRGGDLSGRRAGGSAARPLARMPVQTFSPASSGPASSGPVPPGHASNGPVPPLHRPACSLCLDARPATPPVPQARVQGHLNVYMVLNLGPRHMRTRIVVDDASPR